MLQNTESDLVLNYLPITLLGVSQTKMGWYNQMWADKKMPFIFLQKIKGVFFFLNCLPNFSQKIRVAKSFKVIIFYMYIEQGQITTW